MGFLIMDKPVKSMERRSNQYWAWLVVLAVVVLISIIRIHLLQIPLERDEGEFAYIGKLMLHGMPPYAAAYNMKLPGIYAAYAVSMGLFGQNASGIHLGFLLVNVASIILMFLLGRRLFDSIAGVGAAASFAVLSIGVCWCGMAAHATHYVVLFTLFGILTLLKGIDSERKNLLFISGLLFGVAILMKQSGAVFTIFALLYLLWIEIESRKIIWRRYAARAGLVFAGSIIPYLLTCLMLWGVGVFPRFWFWTVQYAREYAGLISLAGGLVLFSESMLKSIATYFFFYVAIIIGFVYLLLDRKKHHQTMFMICFLVLSIIGVSLGLYFRPHYFVLAFPAFSLLIGVALSHAVRNIKQHNSIPIWPVILIVYIVSAIAWPVCLDFDYYFKMSPVDASFYTYKCSIFCDSIEIARYIKAHTMENDKIAVLGSEPQIYFYADRSSATGYMYTYPLMENQKYASMMQHEMMGQIMSRRPKYIVLVCNPFSWLAMPYSDKTILNWSAYYLKKYYRRVGLIEIVDYPDDIHQARYLQGENTDYNDQSSHTIEVYERK